MSPFPHEMAKSFVRGWQGSSSVGWLGSCSGGVQSTGVSPALEGSSHKTPGNTFFQRKKAPKCWMQQTTKPAQRNGGPVDQAQIPAPGNDLLFPMAVPGAAIPPVVPEPCSSRADSTWAGTEQGDLTGDSHCTLLPPPPPHHQIPIKLCPTNCGGWKITGFNHDKTERRGQKEEEQEALGFPRSRPLPQLCPVPVKEEVWVNLWQGRDAVTTACGKLQSPPDGPPSSSGASRATTGPFLSWQPLALGFSHKQP